MIPDIDGKDYLKRPEQVLEFVVDCPCCGHFKLWRNGSYDRWIPDDIISADWTNGVLGKIHRLYCPECKTSFSLLPDFLVPGRSYSRSVISRWLHLALDGEPIRCRKLFEELGIAPEPEPEPGQSWTDTLLHHRTLPGYQLLATWLTDFTARAQTMLPMLLFACVTLGCDLKSKIAEPLSTWNRVPTRAIPLALCLGFYGALRGEEKNLVQSLPELVIFLSELGPHKVRRVGARRGRYPPK